MASRSRKATPPATRKPSRGAGHSDDRHSRDLGARLIPFAPPWFLAALVPIVGLVLHNLWGGDPVATPWAALGVGGATAALSVLAWHVGREARRRLLIRAHTTATVAAAGAAVTVTMIAGAARPWADIMFGAAAVFAFSWNLRGFDALRSETRDHDGDDTWGDVIGLRTSRPGKIEQKGARTEIRVHHGPGETVKEVQAALPLIEAARGGPAGRSRAVPDPDDASVSTMVLVDYDVLKHTIPWPGPSSPGGSVVDPLVPGVYEDDLPVHVWLPNTPPTAKVYRPASHLGYMGVTRSGKTLTAQIITTDLLTRSDVCVIWADGVKGEQTAGPLRDGLTLYANNLVKVKYLFKGLQAMIRARTNLLGQAGYRQWEPACYTDPNLRMPWVHVQLEECDEYVGTDEFVWLASKALSAGVSLSPSLQRASHSSMPTDGRYNITGWLCFGVGDDVSASFALSDATIAAGAHPENWKNRKPGYFYAETGGIEDERHPVPARSYFATDEQMAAVVRAHAHVRAKLDEASIAALGKAWAHLQPYPSSTPGATNPAGAAMSNGTRPGSNGAGPDPADLDDFDDDDIEQAIAEARALAHAEIDMEDEDDLDPETAAVDPRKEVPPFQGNDTVFDDRPEAATPEEARRAVDDALRSLAREGRTTFQVADLVARIQVRSRSWASRRLSNLCEDATITPPGLRLRRDDRPGVYHIEHVDLEPALAGAQAN